MRLRLGPFLLHWSACVLMALGADVHGADKLPALDRATAEKISFRRDVWPSREDSVSSGYESWWLGSTCGFTIRSVFGHRPDNTAIRFATDPYPTSLLESTENAAT